jgi:hypothetical protein
MLGIGLVNKSLMRELVQLRQRWRPHWLMLEICQCDWARRKIWAWQEQRWETRVLVYGAVVRARSREGLQWWEWPKNNPKDSGGDITSARRVP